METVNSFYNLDVEKNLINIIYESINYINAETDKSSSFKHDGTVITKADKLVDNIIKKHLKMFYPQIPIISEEGEYIDKDFTKDIYWLIDPIDGTSSYINGKDEFTVNIALIINGSPIIGIIGHPPSNSIWFGNKNLAFKIKDGIKKNLETNKILKTPRITISNRLDKKTENFLKKIKNFELQKCSSSIKFCKISEGLADFYPRLESINKWDIAAGDAILRASGGMLLDSKFEPFQYNCVGNLTGSFYAVSSKVEWSKILLSIA